MKRLFFIVLPLALFACNEAPLFSGTYDKLLNGPSSIHVFSGTTLALISNTNINLQESNGSILVYDISTQSLVEETRFPTTNFGAFPLIDEDRDRIVIPDLDQYLRFYTYAIPGSGGDPVSFVEEGVAPQATQELNNAVEVDENPSDIKLVETDTYGDIYLVANQLGTISVIDADDLDVRNLNDDQRYQGLRLTSALTLSQDNGYPASGINRLFVDPVSNLVYATNASSNLVYIFDPENLENEGVLSFLSIAGSTSGIRSIAFDSNQQAYIAHAGLQSVIVVDFSVVTNNGISHEVIEPTIISIVPVYGVPNEIVLNPAEDTAFVSIQDTNEIIKMDIATLSITDRMTLTEGRGPSTLYFDTLMTEILSLNFFSSSLTRVDPATLNEIEEVE